MDEKDLPTDLASMTVPRSQLSEVTVMHPVQADNRKPAEGHGDLGQQLDPGGDNGPGGVSPSAPVAAPALPPSPVPSPAPMPLIPDQPLAPGTPAALAGLMGSPAELSTPSPGLSTGAGGFPDFQGRHGLDHAAPIAPAAPAAPDSQASPTFREAPGQPAAALPSSVMARRPGKPLVMTIPKDAPRKPRKPEQIAEFANIWTNPEWTVEQVAAAYDSAVRTVQNWRREFNLPEHPIPLIPAALDGLILPGGQLLGDPSKDEEIVEAVRDIQAEARIISPHSDLQVIQRKLARLSILIATKTPLRSWEALNSTFEGLARSVLNARRIEADIPRGDVDPVMLRKEAAGQLMRELKSVLTPEEQSVLAKIVKLGADRLMKRGADGSSLTTSAQGGS